MSGFIKLVPILMVIVVMFALLQGYTAFTLLRAGSYPFAALYGVLAIAGLALARGLWVQRRNLQSRKP
jgi:hypothetical protein